MKTKDPVQLLADVLRAAIGDLLSPEARTLPEMFAEDGVMEFPYAPPGGVHWLVGRAALEAYLSRIAGSLELDHLSTSRVHRTLRPGTVVLELTGLGRATATNRPYHQRYISVVTVKDGRITRYIDYWNPLVVLDAMGGEAAMAAALRGDVVDAG